MDAETASEFPRMPWTGSRIAAALELPTAAVALYREEEGAEVRRVSGVGEEKWCHA